MRWLLRDVRPFPPRDPLPQHCDLLIDADRVVEWAPAGEIDPSSATVLDLEGRWLLPAFVDSHQHLLYSAQRRAENLTSSTTPSELMESLPGSTRGNWLVDSGWRDPFPAGLTPDPRRFLDSIDSNRPIFLWAIDHHRALVNSAALAEAKIDPHLHSGVAVENEAERIWKSVPDAEIDLLARIERLHRLGIAAVTTFDRGASRFILEEHCSTGDPGLWIRHGFGGEELREAIESGETPAPSFDREAPFLLPWIKLFLDGTLGSRTAWMKEAYSDLPVEHGVRRISGDNLRRHVDDAASRGWGLAIHAIGDRAVQEAITAIELAQDLGARGIPHRIEHAQLIDQEDLPRLVNCGAIASIQACHLIEDQKIAPQRWGHRCRAAFPLATLESSGVPVILGSDAPIESADPWIDIAAAVHRKDLSCQGESWFPQECLSFSSAFSARTSGAADGNLLPPGWGTLAPGTRADLQILETEDPTHTTCCQEAKIFDLLSFGKWRLGKAESL